MQHTAPTSPSELIKLQWNTGGKNLAQATEKACRIADPEGKYFSCATEIELSKFVTVDPKMKRVKEMVQTLQSEQDPVLIVGPTGTGKEILARALHGGRWGKFIPVNCTALPSELLESELFGHKKGAFTGADSDRIGKFRAAHRGTLFLDEIGDMPIDMQAKLLRALQEKKVTPLGSEEEESVQCRVVAATNRSVEELLGKVHFRTDLYYRLAVFTLETTPLLDRPSDIEHIVDSLGGQALVTKWKEWDFQDPTCPYDVKGNVRSLQAQVRRYQVLGEL